MLERTQGPVFVKPELLRDQRKGWEDGWAQWWRAEMASEHGLPERRE